MPKLQEREVWCGPAALQCALEYFGYYRSQKYLATMMGVTSGKNSKGADDPHMKRGIERCGFKLRQHTEKNKERAELLISSDTMTITHDDFSSSKEPLKPVLLPVDKWDHWVVLLAWVNFRCLVFDPGNYRGSKERGGLIWTPEHLLIKRWVKIENSGPEYHGIVVYK